MNEMTEFEVYEESLKRMWTKIDNKSKCEVTSRKSAGIIDVYDYWGTRFLEFEFDKQGNLIGLDACDEGL